MLSFLWTLVIGNTAKITQLKGLASLAALFSIFMMAGVQSSFAQRVTANPLLAQAKVAEEKRDYPRAVTLYQEFLRSNPDQPEVLQRLGLVYYLSRQYEKSIPAFERALKLDTSLWGSDLFLGISFYRTGHFDQAEPRLCRALALKPDMAEASFWLGSTLIAKGQPEAAIPFLSAATSNAQLGIDADSLLVKAYRKSAEDYYHRITVISPDSYRVHQLKAQTLEWDGKKNAALLEFQRALRLNPKLEGAHRAMGELYWQEHDFDLAARQFSAELRLNPLDAESNLRLGEYRLAKGDAASAITYLSKALASHTTREAEARHYLNLARKAL